MLRIMATDSSKLPMRSIVSVLLDLRIGVGDLLPGVTPGVEMSKLSLALGWDD